MQSIIQQLNFFFIQCLFLKIYQHSWIIIGSTPMYFHEILMDLAEKTNCSQIIQVNDHEMAKTAQDLEPHLSLNTYIFRPSNFKNCVTGYFSFQVQGDKFCFFFPTNFQILVPWYPVYSKDKECFIIFCGSCFLFW